MKLEFAATDVSYQEANGGDIVQASFSESENDDPFNPNKLYLHISSSYEFGSPNPHAEWFDGNEENGGVEVACYKICDTRATIELKNGHVFKIVYQQDAAVLTSIRSFLARDCREIDA